MMRTGLRFVCVYLSTSSLQGFRPLSKTSLCLGLGLSPDFLVNNETCRLRMTSETDSNVDYGVGQADIGAASSDKDLAEGKSWRELIEISSAKSRKIRGSNYVQLATVDPETNAPRCRCVVFRGFQKLPENHPCSNQFLDMSCVMRMITDDRSQKVRESRAAELVWWFPKSSEQYRVRGELIFVGGKGFFDFDNDVELVAARIQQWGNLSDSARESFFLEEIPGESFSRSNSNVPIGGRDQNGKILSPPDNFLLMLLKPNHVDYLRLTNMYRQVDRFTGSEWISARVNP